MDQRSIGEKRMKRTVEKGKTLLVDGPASVTLCSGKVEVFGSIPPVASKVVIREGKRLPFVVHEKSELDISVGENASRCGCKATDGYRRSRITHRR